MKVLRVYQAEIPEGEKEKERIGQCLANGIESAFAGVSSQGSRGGHLVFNFLRISEKPASLYLSLSLSLSLSLPLARSLARSFSFFLSA